MGKQDPIEAATDELWFREKEFRRLKFQAIAATTKDGRPSFEQLKMNRMLT